ncbi:hypothetical protein GQ55_8G176800 [Panicum hallii var. hallii]|uniref:Uncharacterized protein n=1 Tax=Panicum hallii var. hallii TaxID=1504633 RepID=A0A2T7CNJ9_9POAL|nr:hypothetical protein GQ55_8G176800 [Panicum hallii var. hallii]
MGWSITAGSRTGGAARGEKQKKRRCYSWRRRSLRATTRHAGRRCSARGHCCPVCSLCSQHRPAVPRQGLPTAPATSSCASSSCCEPASSTCLACRPASSTLDSSSYLLPPASAPPQAPAPSDGLRSRVDLPCQPPSLARSRAPALAGHLRLG